MPGLRIRETRFPFVRKGFGPNYFDNGLHGMLKVTKSSILLISWHISVRLNIK